MWRDAGEWYVHAIKVGGENTLQDTLGCGTDWGKVNACILHLCNRKVLKQNM